MNPYKQMQDFGIVDLVCPNYDPITLDQLAYALAHVNRFDGNVGEYSVAQHSVHCAAILRDHGYPAGVQAGALCHDLHEAVTGDVSTPIKTAIKHLSGWDFRDLEAIHILEIERRFAVHTRHAVIKRVDAQICNTEADQLLGGRVGPHWPDVPPLDFQIPNWTADRAYREFLDWAHRLGLPK